MISNAGLMVCAVVCDRRRRPCRRPGRAGPSSCRSRRPSETISRARSTVMPLCLRSSVYSSANCSSSSPSCGSMTGGRVEVEAQLGGAGADRPPRRRGSSGRATSRCSSVRRRAQDPVVAALGQHDVLAVGAGPVEQRVLEHQRRDDLGPRDVERAPAARRRRRAARTATARCRPCAASRRSGGRACPPTALAERNVPRSVRMIGRRWPRPVDQARDRRRRAGSRR